jgi:hypothetical protein
MTEEVGPGVPILLTTLGDRLTRFIGERRQVVKETHQSNCHPPKRAILRPRRPSDAPALPSIPPKNPGPATRTAQKIEFLYSTAAAFSWSAQTRLSENGRSRLSGPAPEL